MAIIIIIVITIYTRKIYILLFRVFISGKMKRKVNLVGQSTLTVSLPTKWAKDNEVQKGDELDVLFDQDDIIFSKKERKQARKEALINVDENTYLSLARHIALLYRTNYDKITLVYSKQEVYDPKGERKGDVKKIIKKIVSCLLGAEIISQTDSKTEIECFVSEERPDLDKIEKRIHFLIREAAESLIAAIGKDYHVFHEAMYDRHDNIAKFINYFLRELHRSDKSQEEKKIAYSYYELVDNLTDKLRHVSEKIDQYGCSPKLKGYLNEIFEFFFDGFKLLDKKQLSQEFIKLRYDIKRRINNESFNVKELRVLNEASFFMDTLNYTTEYVLLKSLENKNE